MEESQGQTEETHFPESLRQNRQRPKGYQGLYERLAWLLQYREHENKQQRHQWMAVRSHTYVHLEAVETA